MEKERLPKNCDLFVERGFWKLCRLDDEARVIGFERGAGTSSVRIGPARGPDRITEEAALQIVWEHYLAQLQDDDPSYRPQLKVAEFVEMKFVPEYVAKKGLAGRAHYQAILKHIITPERVNQIFRSTTDDSKTRIKAIPDWPYLDDLAMSDVRHDHLKKLIEAAFARGYSTSTVAHFRGVVSVIFNFARKQRCFTGKNPARLVRLPEMIHKPTQALTLDETGKVLGLMGYPEREIMLVAMLTDLNVAEICGLQWKHVNSTGVWLRRDDLLVPPLSLTVRKQCYRGQLVDVKPSRMRNLPIPDLLLRVFLKLSGRSKFNGPEDFVLVSRAGTPVNANNIAARRLKSVRSSLQLPYLSWLAFRRSHTVWASQLGSEFQVHLAKAIHSNSFQDHSDSRLRAYSDQRE